MEAEEHRWSEDAHIDRENVEVRILNRLVHARVAGHSGHDARADIGRLLGDCAADAGDELPARSPLSFQPVKAVRPVLGEEAHRALSVRRVRVAVVPARLRGLLLLREQTADNATYTGCLARVQTVNSGLFRERSFKGFTARFFTGSLSRFNRRHLTAGNSAAPGTSRSVQSG